MPEGRLNRGLHGTHVRSWLTVLTMNHTGQGNRRNVTICPEMPHAACRSIAVGMRRTGETGMVGACVPRLLLRERLGMFSSHIRLLFPSLLGKFCRHVKIRMAAAAFSLPV